MKEKTKLKAVIISSMMAVSTFISAMEQEIKTYEDVKKEYNLVKYMNYKEVFNSQFGETICIDISKNIIPIFHEMSNLMGADLRGANLSGAILYGVNLDYANLNAANLNHTNLSEANLNHVNLRKLAKITFTLR